MVFFQKFIKEGIFMLKKFTPWFFFLSFAPIFLWTAETELPLYTDFQTIKFVNGPKDKDIDLWHLGFSAFNNAPEIGSIVMYLKRNYLLDTTIETGTYMGSTTVFFSLLFDEVHTIEVNEDFQNQAMYNLRKYKNIFYHLGSSEKIFSKILPSLKEKRLLFYLDAHWQNYWPLLDELEEISKTHRDNCIIIIDDFKIPGRKKIPYDRYNNKECSFEYIKDHLSKIYSEYTFHYIVPKNIQSRAKFVIIPKKWSQE